MAKKRRGRPTPRVTLSDEQRDELRAWTRRHTQSQHLATRARIILASEELGTDVRVAEELGVSILANSTAPRFGVTFVMCLPPSGSTTQKMGSSGNRVGS